MSRLDDQYDDMSLDDFEELLADKPRDETWELIGGRVARMMTGARWEHRLVVRNLDHNIHDRLRRAGSPCRVYTEAFRLRERAMGRIAAARRHRPLRADDAGRDILGRPHDPRRGPVGRRRRSRPRRDMARVPEVAFAPASCPRRARQARRRGLRPRRRVLVQAAHDRGADAVLDLAALDLSIPLAEIYRDVLKP